MDRHGRKPSPASYISQLLRPIVPVKQFTRLFTRLWTHRVEQHELYELAQHVQLRGNYLGIYRRQMPPWTNVSVTQHRFGHCHSPGRYESSIAWNLEFGVWCLVFGVTIHSSDVSKLPVCGPCIIWAHAPIRIDSEFLQSADVDEFALPPQPGSSSIGLGENVKKIRIKCRLCAVLTFTRRRSTTTLCAPY